MTRKPILLICLIVGSFACRAQEKPLSENDKIQNVVINMFQQLADRDAEKLKIYCTADIMVLENGSVWNFDTLLQKINQNKMISDFKRINRIDFIKTESKGSISWTSY
ncbi:MAG TPA: hypothetical protein VEV83_00740, partial [Parafilimonas sp.]|nr:hypothetical protein [Parafilimonas sp.]